MSNEQTIHAEKSAAHAGASPAAEMPPYVHLFQKAHQNIGLLERIDEQLAQLWDKRHELQEELRTLQSQINEELEARIHAAGEPPAQILGAMVGVASHANTSQPLPPLAARVNNNRFATEPLATADED